MQVFSTHGGMTFATRCLMRRVLGFLAGVLVSQWLVFGGGDTGSSVIVVGPTLAAAAGLKAAAGREAITVDADRRQLGLRALDGYGATTLYSSMR